MATNTNNLPSYATPPLTEVFLSIQFEKIRSLQAPQIGLLWSTKFRDKYPRTEQHPPIAPSIEIFDKQGIANKEIKLDFITETQTPRCWFIKEDDSELIQVQQDRLLHNWRKTNLEKDYPRYESIKDEFISDFNIFSTFISSENGTDIVPNQCEITYINHIKSGEGWLKHSELSKIYPSWNPNNSDDFIWEAENIRVASQYIFNTKDGKPWGRLYIDIQPVYMAMDKTPVYTVTLTVRGKPLKPDIEGIIEFIDHGREIIVRGFTSVTSKDMHKVWGRQI